MSSSLPEGFALRTATDDDAPAVAELMNAVEEPLGGDAGTSADDLSHYWGKSRAWVVEAGGKIAAFLETFAPGTDWLSVDVYVHPDVQGRGLGTALIRLSEEDARDRGLRRVRNGVLHADARARELLEREGYAPVRHFYRMTIELESEPPAPKWPDGMQLEPFDMDANGREVHAAAQEAFADEWYFQPTSWEEWRQELRDRGHEPSLCIVVRDGDEVAAATICDTQRFGMGWIANVSVRPAWRRRGLGLAMLYEAFGRFRERGERVVGLGVDAENPTGATRLYERAGMSIAWRATVFEKELA